VDVVLRTFESVFPNMEIWDVVGWRHHQSSASAKPWPVRPRSLSASVCLWKRRATVLTSIGLETPERSWPGAWLPNAPPSQSRTPAPSRRMTSQSSNIRRHGPFTIYLHNRGVFPPAKNFDERTWQTDLAPAGVNNDLAKLDPPALKTIFANGGSLNEDLISYLQNRLFALSRATQISNQSCFEKSRHALHVPEHQRNHQSCASYQRRHQLLPMWFEPACACPRLDGPGRCCCAGCNRNQIPTSFRYLSRILIREKDSPAGGSCSSWHKIESLAIAVPGG